MVCERHGLRNRARPEGRSPRYSWLVSRSCRAALRVVCQACLKRDTATVAGHDFHPHPAQVAWLPDPQRSDQTISGFESDALEYETIKSPTIPGRMGESLDAYNAQRVLQGSN